MTLAQHSAANANWGTPSEWVERVRHTLGEIDLDPASSELHNRVVKAKKYYTEKENGLTKDWQGHVFVNPPGGRDEKGWLARQFFAKLEDSYFSLGVKAAVYLGYSLEHLMWLTPTATGLVAVPRRRIKFTGAGNSPTHGNFFFLMAPTSHRAYYHRFVLAFRHTCSFFEPTWWEWQTTLA